jgi:hypothetical protein
MKLVYTFTTQYTSKIYNIDRVDKLIFGYVNYYRESIKKALECGYEVDFYLSKDIIKYFVDLEVNLIEVGNIDSGLFDFLKAKVLKERDDKFILIDGDILLKNKLDMNVNVDCIYETDCIISKDTKYNDITKDKTWHIFYKPYITELTNLGIESVIPEWSGKRYDTVHNIGLLYFNNQKLKNLYVDRWYKFNDFVNNNIENKTPFTVIGAQYLLTELINYYKFTSFKFDDNFFSHDIGIYKFKKPKVSMSKVVLDSKKNIL